MIWAGLEDVLECLKAACGFLKGSSKQNGANLSGARCPSCFQVHVGERKGSGPRRVGQPQARHPEEWGLFVLEDVQSLSAGQQSLLHSRLKGQA